MKSNDSVITCDEIIATVAKLYNDAPETEPTDYIDTIYTLFY